MKTTGRGCRGASILEFLVTLVIMTILAVTAIEFGSIFTRLNTLTKSVQDATRYLADNSDSKSNDGTQLGIAEFLVRYNSVSSGEANLPGGSDDGILDVDISNPDSDHVQITAVYNHTPVAGQALDILLGFFGGSINLSMPLTASSVMRFAQ